MVSKFAGFKRARMTPAEMAGNAVMKACRLYLGRGNARSSRIAIDSWQISESRPVRWVDSRLKG